jgi:hypothetical protein
LWHDLSRPIREVTQDNELTSANDHEEEASELHRTIVASDSPQPVDPVLQGAATSPAQFTPGLSFDGVAYSGWTVGDPNLAVGATQVVQWVNTRFAVYDKKTGGLKYGPANGNTLWNGFGGACATKNSGDPVVQYDKAAGRWVMLQHATPTGGPYLMCLAVSTSSDATGSFHRYAFSLSTDFPDYPKLGVRRDGYYLSFDQPSNGVITTVVCALDRTAMLNGKSAGSVCFQLNSKYLHLLPSDIDGLSAPPVGSPDYFMNLGTDSLNIWQFHVDFVNPGNSTFSGPTNVAVANFSQSCGGGVCIPQSRTTNKLDSVADRLMFRLAYRHFSDGHESLVVAHTVGMPAGIRWYEIRDPKTPFVYQQGTYSPNSSYRWMPSIAMDRAGDMAVGYSLSSSAMHPSIAYTGRLSTDSLGTMEAETIVFRGTGSELPGNNRWDDYTALSVDPQDDCTFWYTNEYYKVNGVTNWSTRIASFKFSGCALRDKISRKTISLRTH